MSYWIREKHSKYSYKQHPNPNGLYCDYNCDWSVDIYGNLYGKRGDYLISASELSREDWFLHLSEKRWFDESTFLPAYLWACRVAGMKIVRMRISNS